MQGGRFRMTPKHLRNSMIVFYEELRIRYEESGVGCEDTEDRVGVGNLIFSYPLTTVSRPPSIVHRQAFYRSTTFPEPDTFLCTCEGLPL